MGCYCDPSRKLWEAGMKIKGKSSTKKETGQILVILALAIVAIFAFAGLAIDGNRIYAARRLNQSTADSAALAGAGAAAQYLNDLPAYPIFKCEIPENTMSARASDAAVTAAVASATKDNVALKRYDLSTGNGVITECEPGINGKIYLDITVKVTTKTPTSLTRVINIDEVDTSATATARFYPNQPEVYGNALVSLNNECAGIIPAGNSYTNIIMGGVWSNSCLDVKGKSLYLSAESITYNENFPLKQDDYSGLINPQPVATNKQIIIDPLPKPECDPKLNPGKAKGGVMEPGNHAGSDFTGTITLNPGLYCINSEVKLSGHDNISGTDVTLYFIRGGLTFNGNAVVNLSAPSSNSIKCEDDAVNNAVPGLLMYVDPDNSSVIQINGTSANQFQGTIYAPSSLVKINGTSDSQTLKTQVIAKTIEISGNASLQMNQGSCDEYKDPPLIELLK